MSEKPALQQRCEQLLAALRDDLRVFDFVAGALLRVAPKDYAITVLDNARRITREAIAATEKPPILTPNADLPKS
jgi:hypothetical protein